MKTYYYVHTGHRIGLDRFRRACAIINGLKSEEIILLSSDFRIAQIAKEYGIDNAVGIDVVRNIPYIAEHGDRLIFDSDEANPIMLEDMKKFFSIFIHIQNASIIVEPKYFLKNEKTVKMTYFFGDDDYEKDLEKNISFIDKLNPYLQLGFYYFLDYEEVLKNKFQNYFEFDEYEDMIKKTDILITASPQAVLDSLASGGRPIYIKRLDYSDDFDEIFKNLNIPIVKNYNYQELNNLLNKLDKHNYKDIEEKSNKLMTFITNNLRP